MKDNTKLALIIVVLAVAAYVVYQKMLQGKMPGLTSVSFGTSTNTGGSTSKTVSTTTTTKNMQIYTDPVYVAPVPVYDPAYHTPQSGKDGIV